MAPYPIQSCLPASEFSQDEICMYALSLRPPPLLLPSSSLDRALSPICIIALSLPPFHVRVNSFPVFSLLLQPPLSVRVPRTVFRQLDTSYYAKQPDQRDIIIIVNVRTVTLRREFLMHDLAIYAPQLFILFLVSRRGIRARVSSRPAFRLASSASPI